MHLTNPGSTAVSNSDVECDQNGEKRAWKKGHLEYGKKPSFSINRFCSNDCKIYICWNLRGMVLWSGTYDTVMCNGAYGSVGFWCLLCPIVTVTDMFTFYFLLNFINFWKVLRKQVSFLGGELLCILYIIKRICIHIFIYIICTSNHILYVYLYIYLHVYLYVYTAHICPDFPGKVRTSVEKRLRGDEQTLLEGHAASGACVPAVKSETWRRFSSSDCFKKLMPETLIS